MSSSQNTGMVHWTVCLIRHKKGLNLFFCSCTVFYKVNSRTFKDHVHFQGLSRPGKSRKNSRTFKDRHAPAFIFYLSEKHFLSWQLLTTGAEQDGASSTSQRKHSTWKLRSSTTILTALASAESLGIIGRLQTLQRGANFLCRHTQQKTPSVTEFSTEGRMLEIRPDRALSATTVGNWWTKA